MTKPSINKKKLSKALSDSQKEDIKSAFDNFIDVLWSNWETFEDVAIAIQ